MVKKAMEFHIRDFGFKNIVFEWLLEDTISAGKHKINYQKFLNVKNIEKNSLRIEWEWEFSTTPPIFYVGFDAICYIRTNNVELMRKYLNSEDVSKFTESLLEILQFTAFRKTKKIVHLEGYPVPFPTDEQLKKGSVHLRDVKRRKN